MKRSLRSWLWRVPVEQEIDEELAFHLEMRTRELIDRGMPPRAARAEAARRLGDLGSLRHTCVDLARKRDREMRLTQWIEELRDDVIFAVRQLRKAPGFTCVSALTLALGIGANSAIFALVDATLLRPLPFHDPDRLVMMWDSGRTSSRGAVSPLNMVDWNAQNRTFDLVAGFVGGVGGMVMRGTDGLSDTVSRQWVTGGFFDVLGVQPIAGRTFHPSDDRQRSNLVVLSEPFWRQRFAGNRAVVGRAIVLDGQPYTVVGVVPGNVQPFGSTSTWALIPVGGPMPPQVRGIQMFDVLGRMKPGVTLSAASRDMDGIAERLARDFPSTNAGHGIALEPLHDSLVGRELRLTSLLLIGVVGLVLLICCANVANLLLARATTRSRELAIRSALGAGRRRLMRQLLTENLVLGTLGGSLGAATGAAILAAAPSLLPSGLLPAAVTLHFDVRVLAFCVLTALVVGVALSVAPAWQAEALAFPLAQRARATPARRDARLRRTLVTSEVAAAVVVLFGAGLLLRTLVAVSTVDRGYRADDVLTMLVDPLGSKYPTRESLLRFYADVEREVTALPGVRSVAWAGTLPMGTSEGGRYLFDIVGEAPVDATPPTADYQIVSPAYFRTLDLPLVAGRGFTDHDTSDSVPVCIVSEAFARAYIHGRPAVGARIAVRPASESQAPAVVRQVVGVARQVKERPDEVAELMQIYVPIAQVTTDDIYLAVRPSTGRGADLAAAVRAAIGRVDKEQLVSVREIMTLEDIARDATGPHRFRAEFVLGFGGLALLLAMVGVFGVLANSVQARVREFGIRRALGATTREVIRPLVGSAIRLVAAGTVLGLILAAMLSRLLATVLFGVQPLDPITFGAVTIVLAVTAIASAAAPAWRAARIDPAVALRSE